MLPCWMLVVAHARHACSRLCYALRNVVGGPIRPEVDTEPYRGFWLAGLLCVNSVLYSTKLFGSALMPQRKKKTKR